MAWLRFLLFTVLLARIAAGGAWAMPMPVEAPLRGDHRTSAVILPCHMDASVADAGIVATHTAAPQAHDGHTSCGHCALCFPALTMAVSLPVTVAAFSVPTTPAKTSSHWQRAPDLRHPI